MNLHARLAVAATTALAASALAVPLLGAPAQAAAAPTLVGASADGTAFDLDEVGPGDVTVQLTDGAAPVDADDALDLTYSWTITPFDTSVPAVRVPATGEDTQATDTNGSFEVTVPTGQPSGTYELTAALGTTVPATKVLTVKAGQAAVELDGDDPLLLAAGSDHTVSGTVTLEDGTALPGRVVDLGLVRGTAGSDPEADAGFVPEPPDTALVTSRQVTTGDDGAFSATLSDPAEDGQGTELGGTLTAAVASAAASASSTVDLVSEEPPTGTTVAVTPLGNAKPGQSQAGSFTVTAPDDTFDTDPTQTGIQGDADNAPDPVEGQVWSLDVDHGFFTTGDEQLPSVVGAPAGNLEDLGTTLTGVTDATGAVSFAVGIARDEDFDDDGKVAATVTATTGSVTGDSTAAWSSDNPLNGGVSIDLSPDAEQPAPVGPAVSGDRTYYEVNSVDQFGNRAAGENIDLSYAGDLDDWDYSDDFVVSDRDTNGDVWVVSFEPADIDVTGLWAAAPTYLYTDANGGAASGVADATGTTTASFYDVDFEASRFSMRSSSPSKAAVGTAVTQTVKVVDQLGNPARGMTVRFFRSGPDAGTGEVRATRTTNARGEAAYTFVGAQAGRARISAVVTDGVDARTLTDEVAFGTPVRAVLGGKGNGKKADVLTLAVARAAKGAQVTLYRVVAGKARPVRTGRLDAAGRATFTVRDRNGKQASTYRAVVRSTMATLGATSNDRKVR